MRDGLLLNTLRKIADDMQSGNSSALGATDLSGLDTNLVRHGSTARDGRD